MKSKLFHSRISRLTLRCVFGMLLCTPAACTSAGKMVSKDPFSGKQPEFSHGQYEPTQGNHSMLEQAGIPLESQPPAVPMDNHQTSMYPQAMPVGMAPGMPPQMDTEGKVRVHNEWPAISEQTVGYRNPQAEAAPPMPEGVLPPGGYETPIGTQQPWHQTAQVETPAQSEIVQTSFEAPVVSATRKSKYTDFTPAEPRVALQPKTCQSCGGESCYCQPASWQGTPCPCPPFPTQVSCTSCNPGEYPDEYLCDGGDRKDPVHYSPGAREGLDTQDTVAEYQDDTGEHHMKPTNEVCVYAPRFGAVKTVAGSSENLGVDRALGAYETVKGLAVNT
ncbi:MAG: hypothetical protein KDA78_12380, partial [Planctomycetaceae bacterium]|nr:hypothetical protein [Planctomycetaceae bacterium]